MSLAINEESDDWYHYASIHAWILDTTLGSNKLRKYRHGYDASFVVAMFGTGEHTNKIIRAGLFQHVRPISIVAIHRSGRGQSPRYTEVEFSFMFSENEETLAMIKHLEINNTPTE